MEPDEWNEKRVTEREQRPRDSRDTGLPNNTPIVSPGGEERGRKNI